jgi:hypothetical protein
MDKQAKFEAHPVALGRVRLGRGQAREHGPAREGGQGQAGSTSQALAQELSAFHLQNGWLYLNVLMIAGSNDFSNWRSIIYENRNIQSLFHFGISGTGGRMGPELG